MARSTQTRWRCREEWGDRGGRSDALSALGHVSSPAVLDPVHIAVHPGLEGLPFLCSLCAAQADEYLMRWLAGAARGARAEFYLQPVAFPWA